MSLPKVCVTVLAVGALAAESSAQFSSDFRATREEQIEISAGVGDPDSADALIQALARVGFTVTGSYTLSNLPAEPITDELDIPETTSFVVESVEIELLEPVAATFEDGIVVTVESFAATYTPTVQSFENFGFGSGAIVIDDGIATMDGVVSIDGDGPGGADPIELDLGAFGAFSPESIGSISSFSSGFFSDDRTMNLWYTPDISFVYNDILGLDFFAGFEISGFNTATLFTDAIVIPAPGVAAVFGTGALMAARRRRAA